MIRSLNAKGELQKVVLETLCLCDVAYLATFAFMIYKENSLNAVAVGNFAFGVALLGARLYLLGTRDHNNKAKVN